MNFVASLAYFELKGPLDQCFIKAPKQRGADGSMCLHLTLWGQIPGSGSLHCGCVERQLHPYLNIQ